MQSTPVIITHGKCPIALTVCLGFVLATTFGSPATETTHVRVQHTPPSVSHHIYAADHPPPEIGNTIHDELGVCLTEFGCNAQLRTSWRRFGTRNDHATITDVAITARISIAVWTVLGSGPAVAAHEETHRRISEHYYGLSDAVAREIGRALIARSITFSRAAAGEQPDIGPVERELIAQFMWRTSSRCKFAQQRFDQITDHSRNGISNERAMAQAIAEEAAHWEMVKDQGPPAAANRAPRTGAGTRDRPTHKSTE